MFVRSRTVVSSLVFVVALAVRPLQAVAQNAPRGPLVPCQSQNYSVAVTPDGNSASWPEYTSAHTDTFTVTNTSVDCADTYALSSTATGTVTGVSLNKTSAFLSPGANTTVIATYSVGDPGAGVLTLKALGTNGGSGVSDTGWFNVTATILPGAPIADVTPYNAEDQDYGRCAVACFASTYAQSTVPYFSLDAARSVTLAYNGDRVDPKAFVHLDVRPDPGYGQTPTEYRLEVKVSGARVTFVNGDTILRFAYPGSSLPVRLGGEFSVSSYATNAYPLDIIVSAYYAPSSIISATWKRKLVVVNETTSPIARGWTLAGIARLYVQSDSSALITAGDGSAAYFGKSGAVFLAPTGDFSQLVPGTPGGGQGWTRRWPDSTKIVFNTSGGMTEVRDRFNNVTTLTYDGSNRVSNVRDPLNFPITLTYNGNGLSAIQDSMGRITAVTVDASQRLTAIADPDNVSTTFGYDGSLRLSTISDRGGHTTTLGYDTQSGKLQSITPPVVEVVNADGSVTSAAPVTTLEPWQKKGVPYVTTWPTPAAAPRTDTVYARVTDPGGHVTRFTVNRWGTPAVVTDPLGRTDSTRFDASGLPIRVRSAVGAVDSAVYNTNGLPTYMKASGMPGASTRYAAWAQADSAWTDDGLFGARYFVGANGRIDSVRVAGGTSDAAVTRYTYESRGRVATVTDPLQHSVQSSQYAGANGNRSQDALPGTRVTTYGYDAYGRMTTVSPPGLATSTTYFSIINRADSARDGLNPVPVRYGYDSLMLTSVTDPKGQTYGFTYNGVGWLTQRTDPMNHSEMYKYSRDGELRRWINRRGQPIDYVYDALHRRTSKSGTNTAAESWAYPNDTVVVATSPVAVDTLIANRQGQLLSTKTAIAGQYYARRYTYTAVGALDSVIPSGGGIAFRARHYVWNLRRGTLTEIKLGASPATTAAAYNTDGRLQSVAFPGGDVVSRSYTPVHATANITTTTPYSATVNRSSAFDAANRVRRHIVSPTDGHQYSYDGLGRLIADSTLHSNDTPCSTDPHAPPDPNGDPCTVDPRWTVTGGLTFAYDSAGNRRDLGGIYTVGNRITGFNGCNYVTDSLDGNVTSRTCAGQTVTFTWTAESRLASLTALGQTTTFDYNAAGRLVRKAKPGLVRHFLWEGDNLLAELDSAGTGKIAEYSYYPGLDNPHALIVRDTLYFAHRDMLGNVIALTDSSQILARTYDYTAFGTSSWNSLDYANFAGKDRARFKGALSFGDGLEDLYYMRNRWYEPRSGRFLSEDPLGLQGGLNQYTFAGDDPVNGRDPTGLNLCIDWYLNTWVDGVLVSSVYLFTTCDDNGGPGGGGGDGPSPPPPHPCPPGPTAWPVGDPTHAPIRSLFGDTLDRPVGSSNPHQGVDQRAQWFTLFSPMAPGVVTASNCDRSVATSYIAVRHDAVYTSYYRHIGLCLRNVGDTVSIFDVLGATGAAGTGPHLHWELDSAGAKKVDPVRCMP